MSSKLLCVNGLFIVLSLTMTAMASDEKADANDSFFSKLPPVETHGFYEVRGGYRLQNDKYLRGLLGDEAGSRRIYHSILADFPII